LANAGVPVEGFVSGSSFAVDKRVTAFDVVI
jgi:hypothetical protein